ncbi:MAG TPA: hypothetical protein PKA05_03810 [Roseiflexaceae bacterium]|nr:hypothetical protein [Roseiflexaceae bacterium]HMP39485.1 hypothetical protein [Roseiflexaceae bacterium]
MDGSKHTRYVLFALGAALGSAIGIVLGSLLTFWIGEETLRAFHRALRRMTGGDDRPNFEMLLQ